MEIPMSPPKIKIPLLDENTTAQFIKAAGMRMGCLYIWPCIENNYSGKDLSFAKYQRVYDCSGLVSASLYEVFGRDFDKRANFNAQMFHDYGIAIDEKDVKPGDLAMYGDNANRLTHVAIWTGHKGNSFCAALKDKLPILSASGGTSHCTTPEIAVETNANVRQHLTHNYRKDFVCFIRLAKT
jgi:hypothetical protein